nr:ferritin-like domain-containing protein [Halobacillus sp. Marseille-Q1614]
MTRDLTDDIEKAINAEYSAIACYEKIAEMASDQATRDQIMEIRNDEQKHFQAFSTIYMQLTGNQPSPEIIEECPETYEEAIDFAFKDEQMAVDFYLDIADSAPNQVIKDTFRRAAADEQNHGVWFLYFMK